MIDGRWCDIKVPDSQDKRDGSKDKSSCKIFVGRVTENLTKEDMKDHFEAFGQVTDVYIPTPFRQFAFVQFSESKAAQSLLGKEHIIKVSQYQLVRVRALSSSLMLYCRASVSR